MPTYPRELNLSESARERLVSYLDEILLNHYAERSGMLGDIQAWQQDYWASPSSEVNTYPFQGACNLVIPINAINVEAVFARFMTTLNALPELVAAKIKRPDLQPAERALEQYIDTDLKTRVRFLEKVRSPILEAIKLGTGVGYSTYERVTKTAVRTVGDSEDKYEVVVREGATIHSVPLARFLYPFSANSLEDAPWVGQEHSRTPYELKIAIDSGLIRKDAWDALGSWIVASSSPSDAASGQNNTIYQQQLENRTPVWPKELHWVEIWCAFDVDDDGVDEEIVVHYHKEARCLMSVRYNWHDDLRRKYRVDVYMPIENRINGIGIGKQVEQFMQEITTIHRQTIDAGTLANSPMLKVSKLSGYGPGEPIFPGKMWFLDDMSHVEMLRMPEVYQSIYANQQQTTALMQQRTGINDVTLGMPQAGTPGTATDTLARVREGSNKFDYVYSNTKSFCDDLIVDYMCDTAQFGARNLQLYQTQDSMLVQQVLSLSPYDIRTGLVLELRTSGQKDNKLQDRQDWQQLAPQISTYIGSLIQLAQMTGDTRLLAALIQHGFTASEEAMRQILQTFDVRNLDRILFNFNAYAAPQGNGSLPGPGNPALGTPSGLPGNGQNAGLPSIAALLGGVSG